MQKIIIRITFNEGIQLAKAVFREPRYADMWSGKSQLKVIKGICPET